MYGFSKTANDLRVIVAAVQISSAVVPSYDQVAANQFPGICIEQRYRVFRVPRRGYNLPVAKAEPVTGETSGIEIADLIFIRQVAIVFEDGKRDAGHILKGYMGQFLYAG